MSDSKRRRTTSAWIRRGAGGASLRVTVACTGRLVAATLLLPPCILYARVAWPTRLKRTALAGRVHDGGLSAALWGGAKRFPA
jgi:hypothetical protein